MNKQKRKTIKPFCRNIKPISKESQISLTNLLDTILSNTPLWTFKQLEVILDLSKLPKINTHLATYQVKPQNIKKQYSNHTIVKRSLPKETSIFSAEVYAIDLELNLI